MEVYRWRGGEEEAEEEEEDEEEEEGLQLVLIQAGLRCMLLRPLGGSCVPDSTLSMQYCSGNSNNLST